MSRTFDIRNEQVRELVLETAARVVRDGELLVIPTDTVYGIAADAFSPAAVAALLAAKGRGRDMPPPVLVKDPQVVMALAEGVDARITALTEAFWPGPLTLICHAQPMLDWDLGDAQGTVALRMPDDADALALLGETGPLAVSSANTHGEPAAETAEQASAMLGESVSVYLDAGPRSGQGSSTIVDMTVDPPRIVRAGPISAEALAGVVPEIAELDG
ncbi:L-threonylcarbamoyladenylate synthase [Brevibacterium album]|uniref:L-threonylcarbamoyladenylate synthase n=1 Tax=Brevibacterium album TaxID=417948 RepID=UPI0004114131|nr:L-threonylcarbamoyladenylate synthase [Brevibacterium album]